MSVAVCATIDQYCAPRAFGSPCPGTATFVESFAKCPASVAEVAAAAAWTPAACESSAAMRTQFGIEELYWYTPAFGVSPPDVPTSPATEVWAPVPAAE